MTPLQAPGAPPEDGVAIRAATADDLDALLALHAILDELQLPWRVFSPRPRAHEEAAEDFRRAMADPDVRVTIAQDAGSIVGTGVGRIAAVSSFSDEPSIELTNVVVLPAFRGRGIGRAIVADLAAFGRARGIRIASLRVFADNDDAERFWSALGFRPRILQMVAAANDL